MNFKPELVEKILAGRKTQTRRVCSDNPRSPWFRDRCSLVQGREYAVCPGRGKPGVAHVEVRRTWRHPLVLTVEWEARAEGFKDCAEFFDYFEGLHGPIPTDLEVWAVEFALIPTNESEDS